MGAIKAGSIFFAGKDVDGRETRKARKKGDI